jgi:hypothetical protein
MAMNDPFFRIGHLQFVGPIVTDLKGVCQQATALREYLQNSTKYGEVLCPKPSRAFWPRPWPWASMLQTKAAVKRDQQ